MLQRIREKATGPIAWAFLAIIAVVFIFWGVDFGGSAATYAAKVDGDQISANDVRRVWQQQQSRLMQFLGADLPEDMVKAQQSAIIDQFVREALLEKRAHKYGLRVSDAALVERLHQIPEFQVDGKFVKDRYYALLRANGMTETQFERRVESEMLITQVQSGVIDTAFVTAQELDRRYAIEQQERALDYALIPTAEFSDKITVTDEQVQKWYEDNQADYLLPEKVDLQYLELTRATAEAEVQVTEEGLRQFYEQIKDRFVTTERRRARHILITTGDGVDDAAAEKKAADLAEQAKGGADFAALAKDNSKDPGSAAQGGDLGWAERGMFVGPFEEALFAMSRGEVRGPVKTQFGYHVIKLEDIEAGHARSFDEVRAELESEYRAEQSQTAFYEESQKLGDLAFESLTELEPVAAAMNLPLKTVSGFTREGGGELGNDPEVIKAAFSTEVLEERRNSPLVAVGEDRAIVLRVTAHTPAEPRPLEEVREEIVAAVKAQAARDAARAKGEEALARLSQGESWDEVAKAVGISPVGRRFVTRRDSIAPAAVIGAAFGVAKPGISEASPHYEGVTTDDGNYVVFQLSDVRDGSPASETEAARTNRRRMAERQVGNEEFVAYMSEAERNADIVKNLRVFE
jgi:peptidyl-prolyl cis-trans isomerase D